MAPPSGYRLRCGAKEEGQGTVRLPLVETSANNQQAWHDGLARVFPSSPESFLEGNGPKRPTYYPDLHGIKYAHQDYATAYQDYATAWSSSEKTSNKKVASSGPSSR